METTGKRILIICKNQGRELKWVAKKIEIGYQTFLYRLKKNKLLADDLINLSKVLEFNLEDFKNDNI